MRWGLGVLYSLQIINQCSKPPSGAVWHLERSLRWIEPSHLEGLHVIRLVNNLSEPFNELDERYKGALAEAEQICGWYTPQNERTESSITLNLTDIYQSVPRVYWWMPVPTLLIASTLAHEIAHHLVATRGYVFKRGENLKHFEYEEVLANRYATSVMKRMEERWYYRLGRWMINDLADHHDVLATFAWKEKKYEKSAKHWYRAWCLNPDLDEAAYWYWRAKRMNSADQPNRNKDNFAT